MSLRAAADIDGHTVITCDGRRLRFRSLPSGEIGIAEERPPNRYSPERSYWVTVVTLSTEEIDALYREAHRWDAAAPAVNPR